MKFVAIDVETTGLDVFNDHILEIAICTGSTTGEVAHNCILIDFPIPDGYEMNPIAKNMCQRRANMDEVRKKYHVNRVSNPEEFVLVGLVTRFLTFNGYRSDNILVVGQGFGQFDSVFLRRIFPTFLNMFNRRFIDLGTLFFTEFGEMVGLDKIIESKYSWIKEDVDTRLAHCADYDATMTAKIASKYFQLNWG
jgi:oligoribonuclease (3'-5' exoribonuclease)